MMDELMAELKNMECAEHMAMVRADGYASRSPGVDMGDVEQAFRAGWEAGQKALREWIATEGKAA